MSIDLALLRALADGEFHSGEELGALFGISRAAIWKQLQKLEEAVGGCCESIKGKGYRLVGGIELLDAQLIQASLPEPVRSLLSSLTVLVDTDSTNREAMQLVQSTSPARGHVVMAERQLAGRGRRGRPWVSPFARNLYFSATWEFDAGAAALEGLSLAVGVAVARALRAVGVPGVGLKWPNDVVANNGKLAGILLEMTGDAAGRCQVIIGIGINVAMEGAAEVAAIDQQWTDASSAAGKRISRNALAAALIGELLPLLTEFEHSGLAPFREEWLALDIARGRSIALHFGDQHIFGTAAGVDDTGALIIETAQGPQRFHGGEVSMRLQQ